MSTFSILRDLSRPFPLRHVFVTRGDHAFFAMTALELMGIVAGVFAIVMFVHRVTA